MLGFQLLSDLNLPCFLLVTYSLLLINTFFFPICQKCVSFFPPQGLCICCSLCLRPSFFKLWEWLLPPFFSSLFKYPPPWWLTAPSPAAFLEVCHGSCSPLCAFERAPGTAQKFLEHGHCPLGLAWKDGDSHCPNKLYKGCQTLPQRRSHGRTLSNTIIN